MWFLVFFLLWPQITEAAAEFQILGLDYFDPELEIISDQPFSFREAEEKGFLLEVSPGVTYVIYSFGKLNFKPDRLTVTLGSDTSLELTVVPNVSRGGSFTYEFQKEILPGAGVREYDFSLHHVLFRQAADFGLKFEAKASTLISLRQIKLSQLGVSQKLLQPLKDYFQTAPYSGFTVNVFPTPRIFGRSAFLYLLPIFLILMFLILTSKRWRKRALIGLLILWLLTDFRMVYEFLSYQIKDYQTWVKPVAGEKRLRTYDDFYVFADWLKTNLPAGTDKLNFYYLENEHFPRLLQYYLYPTKVIAKGEEVGVLYVIFHKPEIKEKILAEGAKELSSFSNDSGIYQKPPHPSLSPFPPEADPPLAERRRGGEGERG